MFHEWLIATRDDVNADGYRHQVYSEEPSQEPPIAFIRGVLAEAHRAAMEYFADAAGSLAPPGVNVVEALEPFHPRQLPESTRMGYFGEILAGVLAQSTAPHGIDNWEVPEYLFRTHTAAFDYLERVRQGARALRAIPGRFGDDCMAFARDADGEICATLACEAKCYAAHSSTAVEDAHIKISDKLPVPASVLQLISVLKDSADPLARDWIEPLQRLRLRVPEGYRRYDMVVYVCGQRARDTHGYLPCDPCHDAYTGGRPLEGIDVTLRQTQRVVTEAYDFEVGP